MLDINASYHCMQFQGELMHQTWENGQNSSFKPHFGPFLPKFDAPKFFCGVFRPNFGNFGPNLGCKKVFSGFYLYDMSDIIASYHYMQF